MRNTVAVFSAVTAGLALSVAAALPASAAVVTTTDVPAAEFIDLTDETFGEFFLPLVAAGPVDLPASFAVEADFAASGIAAGAPGAGCTRVVNSVTIEFTTEPNVASGAFQIVFASGAPAEYLPGATFEYEGDGEAGMFDGSIVNVSIPTSETGSTSLVTIVPAIPATDQTVLSVLGAFNGSSGAITAATFNVTDTCPDAAVVSAVVPDVLPATGVGSSVPLVFAAIGAVLAGGLVIAGRRRAQH